MYLIVLCDKPSLSRALSVAGDSRKHNGAVRLVNVRCPQLANVSCDKFSAANP